VEGRAIMNDNTEYQGPTYPTQAHGSILALNSYEEEAAFWDSHSVSDFKEETFPVEVRSTRGLTENIQVRLDKETRRKLEEAAREQGVKQATLIRMVLKNWLRDRDRHAS
jgi:predicted HicB family RNase H-like nuclease